MVTSSVNPDATDRAPADIKISAQGDRRTLEAVYLELRELAAKNGLKVEYKLSLSKPESGGPGK